MSRTTKAQVHSWEITEEEYSAIPQGDQERIALQRAISKRLEGADRETLVFVAAFLGDHLADYRTEADLAETIRCRMENTATDYLRFVYEFIRQGIV